MFHDRVPGLPYLTVHLYMVSNTVCGMVTITISSCVVTKTLQKMLGNAVSWYWFRLHCVFLWLFACNNQPWQGLHDWQLICHTWNLSYGHWGVLQLGNLHPCSFGRYINSRSQSSACLILTVCLYWGLRACSMWCSASIFASLLELHRPCIAHARSWHAFTIASVGVIVDWVMYLCLKISCPSVAYALLL